MRVAGHTNTYHSYSLEAALSGIANAGFKYVELSAVPGWTEHVDVKMSARAIHELKRALASLNLTPVSLSAHADLTTDAGVEHTIDALHYAKAMGISVVNTAIGGHAGREEDEKAFLARIKRIADEAEYLGLVVALETHGDLMATGRRSADLLARIGREAIRLNYDTANVRYYGGIQGVEDLKACVSWVAHMHLKDHVGGKGDWNFPALGKGQVDFVAVFDTLRRTGFAGPVSVELEFQGEPWPPLEAVDQAMKDSFEFLKRLGVV